MAIIGDALRQAFMQKHEYESLRDEDKAWSKLQRPILISVFAFITSSIFIATVISLKIMFPSDPGRRPFCKDLRIQPLSINFSTIEAADIGIRGEDRLGGAFYLTDQETVDYYWMVVFVPSAMVFAVSVVYLVAGITVSYTAPTRHGCLKVVENNYCASKRGNILGHHNGLFVSVSYLLSGNRIRVVSLTYQVRLLLLVFAIALTSSALPNAKQLPCPVLFVLFCLNTKRTLKDVKVCRISFNDADAFVICRRSSLPIDSKPSVCCHFWYSCIVSWFDLVDAGSRCSIPLFWCYEIASWGLVILYGGTAFHLRRKAATVLDESEFGGRNLGLEMLEAEFSPDVERRVNEGFRSWMGSSYLSSDDDDDEDQNDPNAYQHLSRTNSRQRG
ncbi:hypothetical protein OSB04_019318 [Centaurea solstitialis]|uniref:Transmembrane protein n=1 Tax=Centaurea solstitialis TaxID=347529 RepID=A0AA38T2C4_9ASTR|nr:hypothetical protein OSB04_019318 [Centaurea solstitialis]